MEIFSRKRWSLYRPVRWAVVFVNNQKLYAAHAWQLSIHVWLLGRPGCSSPSTKELHGLPISTAIHHSAPIQCRTYQRSVVHLSFWNPDGQRFVFRAGSSCPTAPEVHESVEIDLQLSKQNQLWQATCLLYSKGNLPTFFLNIFLNFLFHNWPMWQPNNSIKSNKPNRIMKKHRYCAWVQKRVCHHQGLNSRHRAWRSVLMFRAECDATQLSRCPQRPCANLTHKH